MSRAANDKCEHVVADQNYDVEGDTDDTSGDDHAGYVSDLDKHSTIS